MSGLVERLRARKERTYNFYGSVGWRPDADCAEAADHITALEARLAERDAEVARATERLGEALHGLSAILLLTKALDDDQTHTAYEKVVCCFSTLKDTRHD